MQELESIMALEQGMQFFSESYVPNLLTSRGWEPKAQWQMRAQPQSTAGQGLASEWAGE